ncbi:hypothetical protein DV736_g5453, partial [Chaetothyriales sp. CBS 134916]
MASKAALIVVDMQKDFCPPGGSLAVTGARETIPLINSLLASPGFVVKVATQDFHPKDHISFASNHPGPNNKPFESFIKMKNLIANKPDETMMQRLWPDHCVQGTTGADFVEGLDVKNVDVFVQKGMDSRVEMYSAFSDSFGNLTGGAGGVNLDLAKTLKERGVTDVYVVGLAGDYCVKFTALDAAKSGFEVFVIEDAQRCVDPDAWTESGHDFAAHGVKVVAVNRIDEFYRQPSELRYTYDLKRNVTPSGDKQFTTASDYKILYNDWPYGVEEAITHLMVQKIENSVAKMF